MYNYLLIPTFDLSSKQDDLIKGQKRQIHEQQRQIQILKLELFNMKNRLMETNCTEVKKCVAEDLAQINNTLMAHDTKILLNKALLNQVIILCNRLMKATQKLSWLLSILLYFTIIDC